ncbi:hypothetical protein GCM10027408_21990 [Microbacterium tumbae]
MLSDVESGLIDPDSALVEDDLARQYGASRNAVREALQQLAAEGIVERARRVGTRVRSQFSLIPTDDASGNVIAMGRIVMDVVESRIVPLTDSLRKSLRLAPEITSVRMVENLFRQGGDTIGVRSAYYSTEHESVDYPRLAVMKDALQDYFGREVGSVASVIGSTVADTRTARLLKVTAGSPMLFRRQVYYDTGENPIQVVFDHYRSDRVLFISESS